MKHEDAICGALEHWKRELEHGTHCKVSHGDFQEHVDDLGTFVRFDTFDGKDASILANSKIQVPVVASDGVPEGEAHLYDHSGDLFCLISLPRSVALKAELDEREAGIEEMIKHYEALITVGEEPRLLDRWRRSVAIYRDKLADVRQRIAKVRDDQ